MGKISNFAILFTTICILVIIIITKTTIQINNTHEKRLMDAMHTKVEYYAKRCYLENNCEGAITLKDLYQKGYLKEVVHPVTKEIIDESTSISYENDTIQIAWK